MEEIKNKIKINNNEFMNYYVFLPEKFKKNMPLLLFLHGIGERGNNIENVKKYALPKYMAKFDIPYIVIAPQCLENNFWDYHIRDLESILERVHKKYKFDKKRICILGSSMGAYGAWNFMIQRPNLFKGIVSVAGGPMLPLENNLKKIKDKAILMYHGDKDDIIDIEVSKYTYDKLKAIDADNITFKIVKDDNHFLTSHAFKDDSLYEWLSKNI